MADPEPVPEIDIDELERRLGAGASVVDVREPHEYEAGHVPGATSIPLGDVPDRLDDVPGVAPVLVICQAGVRSLRASEVMRANGIEAVSVAGGTGAWIDSGRTVVEGTEPG